MEFASAYNDKIKDLPSLKILTEEWQANRGKIVFTNGCFDILHVGHVQYLQEAKSLGDKLIVALNADDSVKRLKGPERPVNTEQDRAIVMAALGCVDAVVIFHEDTPELLIKELKPNVLVKGGDWPVEKIVGHEFVLSMGGVVRSLPFREGHSTTQTIEKIKHLG